MTVVVETLDKLERKIKLTLPVDAVQNEVQARLRKLARTEIFIPMKPAAPDSTAPITKPIAVLRSRNLAMMAVRMTPTIAIVRYWRLRYAEAPC